jgi:hypothetical protein
MIKTQTRIETKLKIVIELVGSGVGGDGLADFLQRREISSEPSPFIQGVLLDAKDSSILDIRRS